MQSIGLRHIMLCDMKVYILSVYKISGQATYLNYKTRISYVFFVCKLFKI